MLLPDGSLDRPALGRRVFGDDAARAALNAVVHPLIGQRTVALLGQARDAGAEVVVHDVPLLVENGLAAGYHLVAVVHAPVEVRAPRLAQRGLPEAEARQRIAAQADDDQRRAVADAWLDNSGSREEPAAAVDRLWSARLVPYAAGVRDRRAADRGPVRLVPADPDWPAAGARLVARLHRLVPDAVAASTSARPRCPAWRARTSSTCSSKVATWQEVEALAEPLADGGFPRREEVTGDPVQPEVDPDPDAWRKRLHRSADPGRHANVHVTVAGTPVGEVMVRFRDRLREDASLRASYEADKRRLADQHPDDVDAYAAGKTELVRAALR